MNFDLVEKTRVRQTSSHSLPDEDGNVLNSANLWPKVVHILVDVLVIEEIQKAILKGGGGEFEIYNHVNEKQFYNKK